MSPADVAARPDQDLRRFLAGQVTSVFGGTLTSTAVSVIAVIALHAGPAEVAVIVIAAMVPSLLLGPLAGVLLDRVRRPRRTLITADLVAALAVGACAALGVAGALSVAVLAGLNLVLGTITLVVEALYFVHLNGLAVADLATARGRLQSGEMLAGSVAGSVAGPLAAAISAPLLLFCDALTYLVSAGCLWSLRAADTRPATTKPRRRIGEEFLDGIAAVRANPTLAAFSCYLLLSGVAASGVTTLRAIFLLDELRLPVALFTVPAVAATLFGAAGALLAPKLLNRGVTTRRLLLTCLPAAGLSAALLPTAGGALSWTLTAAVGGVALPVFFGALSNIALVTVVNEEVGEEYFCRITTLLGSATVLANTVGVVAGGFLGERFGVRNGIWLCVGLGVLAAGALLVVANRRARSAQHHALPAVTEARQ